MYLILLLILFLPINSKAESIDSDGQSIAKAVDKALANKWYEKIKFKGYAHFRYNRLLETNSKLACAQCDRSLGNNQGFFFRRARLSFFGDVTDRIFFHIQADYATAVGDAQNYLQARDAYFDYSLTESREIRIRAGQSKVPYGFETLQSSSLRAAIDRADAIDMGVPNEYDTGVYFMYTPVEVNQRFKDLAVSQYKGTGDYGLFAVGVYNGQSMNRSEKNNDLHRVARLTYPFKFKNGQFLESSISGYEGKFNINGKDYYDQRSAASVVLYPQPLGFQAEYNVGVGPQFDPQENSVRVKNLKGGYLQLNYSANFKDHRFFPFIRYQEYKGGKKLEDGRLNDVREWELGSEWQPNPAFKLTVAYDIADRSTQGDPASTAAPMQKSHQKGNLLRLQAQFNY